MANNIAVPIHLVDNTLPLPTYQTNGSVAFDIYSRIDVTIPSQEMLRIPTNLIVATPPGYALLISARSSLFGKKGLILPNGIGVIDQDYSGEKDEIQLALYNMKTAEVKIERGERLAQGMFVPVTHAQWQSHTPTNSRGGFGSTG